ncbi:MAG: Sir2 family NAD-dependent protein deacetylase [Blautia marasmi]
MQKCDNLHGNIHRNICPHCGRKYPLGIKTAKKVPLSGLQPGDTPQVALFGEMMDSQLMTRATWEIENADTLILLGTTLDSEVFQVYQIL